MTESGTGPIAAGNLLREAREKQGLHIAMLASTMKVPPKKLEALEQGRLDQLPDLAFARALAHAMCRSLRIEPDQVLALLPSTPQPDGLVKTASGLATPYEDRDAPTIDNDRWGVLRRPVFWAAVLLIGGAMGMAWAPQPWLDRLKPSAWFKKDAPAASQAASTKQPGMVTQTLSGSTSGTVGSPAKAASNPSAPPAEPSTSGTAVAASPTATAGAAQPQGSSRVDPAGAPVVETVHSAPASATPPEGVAADIVVRATQTAWVEVTDGRGESLIRRSIQKDETVNISGTPPYRVRLGNVQATELRYKGQPVDIRSKAAGNVVRFELK